MPPTTLTVPAHPATPAWRPRRPRPRQVIGVGLLALVAILASTLASTVAALGVPAATGPAAVGRTSVVLVDPTRDEPATPGPDARRLRVTTWYPAVAGTGDDGHRGMFFPQMPGQACCQNRIVHGQHDRDGLFQI